MVQGGGYRGSVAASFRVRLGRQSVWRRAVERTICAMPATRPSQLLTLQSFGDISRFLREGVADEESRQLRDSLGAMSTQIDEAVRTRRTSTDTTAIGRRVVSLSHCAREHQLSLVERERCGIGAVVVRSHRREGIRVTGANGTNEFLRLSLQVIEAGMGRKRASADGRTGWVSHDELLPWSHLRRGRCPVSARSGRKSSSTDQLSDAQADSILPADTAAP